MFLDISLCSTNWHSFLALFLFIGVALQQHCTEFFRPSAKPESCAREQYNGLENYVFAAYTRHDVSFLPIMRFIALQREQQENSSQTFDDATEALQKRISAIEAAAKSLGGALEKVNTSPVSPASSEEKTTPCPFTAEGLKV